MLSIGLGWYISGWTVCLLGRGGSLRPVGRVGRASASVVRKARRLEYGNWARLESTHRPRTLRSVGDVADDSSTTSSYRTGTQHHILLQQCCDVGEPDSADGRGRAVHIVELHT